MGALANSASKTMTTSSSDDVMSGFITHERITLSTNPTGTSYSWGMSAPMGSAVSRSALTAYDVASPTFIPDVAGVYVLTCTVDGTTYTLRITALSTSVSHIAEVLRLSPVADTQVPAPAVGLSLYCSSTQGGVLVVKNPANVVSVVDVTPV